MNSSKEIHPDIKRAVKKYYSGNKSLFQKTELELDDLIQKVSLKLWNERERLNDKGVGYRVRIAQNYLSNIVRGLKRHPEHQPGYFERKYVAFLNKQVKAGRLEPGDYDKRSQVFILDDKDLREHNFRIKYLHAPQRIKVVYDRKHPRGRTGQKCWAFNQWLALDLLQNKEEGITFYDKEAVKRCQEKMKQKDKLHHNLPLTFKGDKRFLDEIKLPEPWEKERKKS